MFMYCVTANFQGSMLKGSWEIFYVQIFLIVGNTQTCLTWWNVQFPIPPLSEFISGNCWLAFSQYQTKSKVNPKLHGSPVRSENEKWTKIYFLPAITASIILISNIVLTIFRISGCVLWYTAEIRKGNLWREQRGRWRQFLPVTIK